MQKIKWTPSTILINSFLIIITIGTIFLSLPYVTVERKSVGILTALFTATSAISVTGLSIVDVSKTFNMFGQIIILILIQLGGLGIMTFSSMLMMLIGKRITYQEKRILQEDLNQTHIGGILRFIRRLVLIVLLFEIGGAFLLSLSFIETMPFSKAIYYSIFHSISAFCNAGFSLFSDGLEGFKSDYIVNYTIAFLIIFGGIGFAVIDTVLRYINKQEAKLNLNSKLAIKITLILIVLGTVLIYFIEYNNEGTLGGLKGFEKFTAAFFQSVTTRTAGFNTVPLAKLQPASVFLFFILMLVGASPGSTGGGIKTTTCGVLLFSVITIIKNKKDIEISNRRISWNILNRALAVLMISIVYVISISLSILIVEEAHFKEIVFEVVSAFGTVGVSMGITADLSVFSKLLIMITMLIGRVGPLTFALALGAENKKSKCRYPRENILVG